ncbi:hypothetical protein QA641_14440 [Bradyrhizobium sp. CB1650]|uniref:hypothetical protein n=1 Tax=Bradyrhizobium sp. CB1650 TaxID=3039153 RepID=UPI002434AAFD|nr:hypothetical protein [Bradyrhizobium sp. CB1650]WGD55001.1 hypothetical protein QA641_14440 [Bradyrhizobium sp. CB1650]
MKASPVGYLSYGEFPKLSACCSSTIVIARPRANLSLLQLRERTRSYKDCIRHATLRAKVDCGITAGKTLSTDQYLLYGFRDKGRFVRYDVTSFELFNSIGHAANIDGNYQLWVDCKQEIDRLDLHGFHEAFGLRSFQLPIVGKPVLRLHPPALRI